MKERIPGPFEAEATKICQELWDACGEAPKPVLNGNGNPFVAARKIAEKFLEAGHEPDLVGGAMWSAHQEHAITTYWVSVALATARRQRSVDRKVVDIYPGASSLPPLETGLDYAKIERSQEHIRELSERFRAR